MKITNAKCYLTKITNAFFWRWQLLSSEDNKCYLPIHQFYLKYDNTNNPIFYLQITHAVFWREQLLFYRKDKYFEDEKNIIHISLISNIQHRSTCSRNTRICNNILLDVQWRIQTLCHTLITTNEPFKQVS